MEFKYQELFPQVADTTPYRRLTQDLIATEKFSGKTILKIQPKALTFLAKEAFKEVSFYYHTSYLRQLARILEDPEASDNDRFVAWSLLKNAVIAAEGRLPMCQDTGTAMIFARKGEQVWTGANDEALLSEGVFEVFQQRNLRYSQLAPLTMFDENNTGTNLPAQIEICAVPGSEYEFVFIAKGGGSSNKTFLYQETPALLKETALLEFLKEKIPALGTAACPPYHVAVVIGGLSPDLNLRCVRLASAGYYRNLPTTGNEFGRAFRDLEWERRVLELAQSSGLGAQFGGKYLALDVQVIRLPRHAASCPVGIGVSCNADRNIKAKITQDGIFLEQLENHPEIFLPPDLESKMAPSVPLCLDQPMPVILRELSKLPIKTRLSLSGALIVARDQAHARIKRMLNQGQPLPEYFKNHPIYYAGPAKTPVGMPVGSLGPTTASRMDEYADEFMRHGGSLVMIAKGDRT
ncbi:MAG: fumarate hydratase, partial [Candidatus Omnitrophica bacterium]|nr:fumarate hydratase [Candidatus Omnitrophota bacterium]